MLNHGEGGAHVIAGEPSAAVRAQLVEIAVEGNQFAVESIERADPEISVAAQVGHRHRAVENTFHDRVQRRHLEKLMGGSRRLNVDGSVTSACPSPMELQAVEKMADPWLVRNGVPIVRASRNLASPLTQQTLPKAESGVL